MKISIVIPVCKVEKYLQKCIESVLAQTYKDIEILLIDDGSPDRCAQICDEYARTDDRIIVIHQRNSGVAEARKTGIVSATGEYVMLLDGDDWLDEDTIEVCVRETGNRNLECVLFSYVREYPNTSIVAHVMDNPMLSEEDLSEIVYRRLFGLIGKELKHPERLENLGSCCMKMYRKDIALKGRYFSTEEVGSSEDTLFNIFALRGCSKMCYINQPFYHYRKSGNSITSTYRPRLVQQWKRLFSIMEEHIEENEMNPLYSKAMNARIALSILGIGMNELRSNRSFYDQIKAIDKYLSLSRFHEAVSAISVREMPFAWKALLFCSRYRLSLLVWIELKLISLLKGKY